MHPSQTCKTHRPRDNPPLCDVLEDEPQSTVVARVALSRPRGRPRERRGRGRAQVLHQPLRNAVDRVPEHLDDVVGDQEVAVDVQYLYSAPGPGASERVHGVVCHGGGRQTQAHALSKDSRAWLRRRRAKLPLRDPAGRVRDLGISD